MNSTGCVDWMPEPNQAAAFGGGQVGCIPERPGAFGCRRAAAPLHGRSHSHIQTSDSVLLRHRGFHTRQRLQCEGQMDRRRKHSMPELPTQ